MNNELTESLEKYLLAIYEIVKVNKAARVKDVSNYLKLGGPATSDAVKTLAERKYINYVPYGIITITAKGKKKAENKIHRHKTIANFLEKVLMIEQDKIEDNSKKIEYSMSEDVMEKFIQFLTFMENCSCKEPKWVKSYKYYSENGTMQDKCLICKEQKDKFDNSKCCGACCNN
ncbi:MAG: metal-dependent transcriptional regulator [Candidatus Gastranaerophilales bacterium]|nr:metal-dependent transcriptional regulator [Candidatus Gastranaerophilales bacterium]